MSTVTEVFFTQRMIAGFDRDTDYKFNLVTYKNRCRMDKETHLQNLTEQYIRLSRQYLQELQNGKTIQNLKDMSMVIGTLVSEIDSLTQDLQRNKVNDTTTNVGQ
jgi:flagellar biosynthesis chaperone FliJ